MGWDSSWTVLIISIWIPLCSSKNLLYGSYVIATTKDPDLFQMNPSPSIDIYSSFRLLIQKEWVPPSNWVSRWKHDRLLTWPHSWHVANHSCSLWSTVRCHSIWTQIWGNVIGRYFTNLERSGLTQWGLTIELHSFVQTPMWYSWQQRFWTFKSRAHIPFTSWVSAWDIKHITIYFNGLLLFFLNKIFQNFTHY